MKKLIIVESPAKIKTIAKVLGKDFHILSTVGHIKDLPKKELGIHMNGTITIDYVVLEKKDKVIADICKEAQKAGEIYLAPDPDREGELIAWHVAEELKRVVKDSKKIHRITFNEITHTAITSALMHPSTVDLDKVAAQQARRILDRWVGYEVSPILWKKISKGLSAGRVQSVALRLICDREEQIRNFKSEEYWTVDVIFTDDSVSFTAHVTHNGKKKIELKNEQQAQNLVKQLKEQSFHIELVKDSQRSKNPYPPFMTSTLQQSAYHQLGFSVQKTMQIAQKLYEGIPLEDPSTPIALITYMRSDSLRIAESAVKEARIFIDEVYGKAYVPPKSIIYAKNKGQDAHEAIRPISVGVVPEKISKFLDDDSAALYDLIWKRFVACQMSSARYAQRQVTIRGGNYLCKATGSTLLFDGFLKVYQEDEDRENDSRIPEELKENQNVTLKKVMPKQHFTQPPARYSEASLVKELEKEGIGRPSTYATILKTIQVRAYTTLDKKRFVPTELGMIVTKLLGEHLPKIMDLKFTATMEEDLDKIAQGSLKRDTLLREFYASFEKDVALFRGENVKRSFETTNIKCPKCKKGTLVIRFGKAGPFLGCNTFPLCDFTSNFKRLEDGSIELIEQQISVINEACPVCNKTLHNRRGKFGEFIACSGYPECKYIHHQKASFACPLCKGNVVKRTWRGKVFWGCSSYPECKFSISGDIQETACLRCNSPYLLKKVNKGEVELFCPDQKCR
jgi:DNA topoisomerase I